MKKAKFAGIHDYLALLVRRKWWAFTVFVALAAFSFLLVRMIPRIYISETMLQIQPRDVPTDFVKDLISGTTDQRLNAIEQTILSRTNLLKILSQFEAGMTGYRDMNDERKVLKLRKQIQIDFVTEKVRGQYLPIANVRIAYRDRNPAMAQKIASRLAELFMEQESRTRETQVFGTTQFLETEARKVADQLDQSEKELKALKERFRNELPSQLETNLRTLDRLQLQKNGNLEALDRYSTMQLNVERQISETPAMIARVTAPGSGTKTSAAPPNPQVEIYRKKELQYRELLAKTTEKHPDVQRLQAELEQLRKEIPPQDLVEVERTAAGEPAQPDLVPNPLYQSLTAQLRNLKTEMEIREKEKKWIEAEMVKYSNRVQNTPLAEQVLTKNMRTNEELTKQHEELKSKLAQAKLAESLESKQKGAQFAIVDPANYPLDAATPSRMLMFLLACLFSVAAGIVFVAIMGFSDNRIYTQPELERFLGAPVLVEIPQISTELSVVRERKTRILKASLLTLCLGAYLGTVAYLDMSRPRALGLLSPVADMIAEKLAERAANK